MSLINKQKFLAELGKLLTFMYEEDRQLALAMYADMFEAAQSEQELIQKLISPTRQAVLVARSYNAKNRGLAVNAKFGAGSDAADSQVQAFVETILNIRNEVLSIPEEEEEDFIDENQISMFDEDPMAAIAAEEQDPEEDEEDAVSPEADAVPETEAAPEPTEEDDSFSVTFPEESAAAEESPVVSENDDRDHVAEFMASYVSPVEDESSEEEIPVEEDAAEEESDEDAEDYEESEFELEDLLNEEDEDYPTFVRKPRVFLLILFTLISIPLCLIVTALLLIPAVLCFGISVTSILCGVAAFLAVFSQFSVIADLLVALGISIVLLAVGLLFLWSTIWFIFGAIVGFIRGDIHLGSKWCYKEVQIDG